MCGVLSSVSLPGVWARRYTRGRCDPVNWLYLFAVDAMAWVTMSRKGVRCPQMIVFRVLVM
jgi:hypothetical protein